MHPEDAPDGIEGEAESELDPSRPELGPQQRQHAHAFAKVDEGRDGDLHRAEVSDQHPAGLVRTQVSAAGCVECARIDLETERVDGQQRDDAPARDGCRRRAEVGRGRADAQSPVEFASGGDRLPHEGSRLSGEQAEAVEGERLCSDLFERRACGRFTSQDLDQLRPICLGLRADRFARCGLELIPERFQVRVGLPTEPPFQLFYPRDIDHGDCSFRLEHRSATRRSRRHTLLRGSVWLGTTTNSMSTRISEERHWERKPSASRRAGEGPAVRDEEQLTEVD